MSDKGGHAYAKGADDDNSVLDRNLAKGSLTRRVQPAHQLRVLLIEDSPIIRSRLVEALSEIPNVEVTGQAENESDALVLLRQHKWDAVVLDLQLRGGTGLGVLKGIGGTRSPGAKVIVFTNYAFPQYRDRSLSLGADYFFDKAREFHRVREVLEDMARETSGMH